MISVTRPSQSGGLNYGNVMTTPVDQTVQIEVNITALTSREIDADGYLKPGVLLSRTGALIAAMTKSAPDAGTPHQNAAATLGNGVISAVTGRFGASAETITVTMTGSGATAAFTVDGSKSGHIGVGAVGTAFDSPIIGFTIADGSTDWAALNTVVFAVTGGVSDKAFGVVHEAVKVADGNAAGDISAASVAHQLAVCVAGVVNRDIAEDNMASAYTAAELAGCTGALIISST